MIDSREGVNEVQTLGLAGTRLWPRGHRKRRKGKCLLTGLTQSPSLPLLTSPHHSSQENLPFLPTGWMGKLRGLLITTGVPTHQQAGSLDLGVCFWSPMASHGQSPTQGSSPGTRRSSRSERGTLCGARGQVATVNVEKRE